MIFHKIGSEIRAQNTFREIEASNISKNLAVLPFYGPRVRRVGSVPGLPVRRAKLIEKNEDHDG